MKRFTATGLAALVGAACGEAPAVDAGAWTPETAWRLERLWGAGGDTAEGPTAFGQVRGLAVDGAGRVWVIDHHTQALTVLDGAGAVVRVLGRPGGGPGEFRGLYGIGIGRDQRVWAVDYAAPRFTVFDTAGALLGTYRRETTCWGFAWWGRVADDDMPRDVTCDQTGGSHRELLVRYDTTLQAFVDSSVLPAPPGEPPFFRFTFAESTMFAAVPFAPSQTRTLAPDGGAWLAWTGAYRVVRLNARGDTTAVIHRDVPPVSVSQAERVQAIERLVEAARGQEIDRERVPRVHPLLERLIAAEDGYLWVLRRTDPLRWGFDVFDPDGRFLGTIATPEGLVLDPYAPFVIREDGVWTVMADALGTPVVTRFRIRGR